MQQHQCDGYSWSQTSSSLEVRVAVAADSSPQVNFGAERLHVCMGPTLRSRTLLGGELGGSCLADQCTTARSADLTVLVLTLVKTNTEDWTRLFTHESEACSQR